MTIRPRPFFAIPRLSSPESQLTSTSIFVGESDVSLCNLVRNLGLLIDSSTTLHHNVSAVVWTCYFHLRTLGKLRPFLTKKATISVAVALVLSRLDYCNSCFGGCRVRTAPSSNCSEHSSKDRDTDKEERTHQA